MAQKDILFIRQMFAKKFSFMDNWEKLWDMMKNDIISDIEDTAGKNFTSGDVDIAIARRTLKLWL